MNIFANLTANNLQSIQNGTRNLSLSLSLLPVAIAIATLSSVRCFSVFISISICDLYVCLRRCRSVCLIVCLLLFVIPSIQIHTSVYSKNVFSMFIESDFLLAPYAPALKKNIPSLSTFASFRHSDNNIIYLVWFGLVLFRIYCYIFILVVPLVWLRLSDSSLLVEFHLDFRKYNMLFWFISVSMK